MSSCLTHKGAASCAQQCINYLFHWENDYFIWKVIFLPVTNDSSNRGNIKIFAIVCYCIVERKNYPSSAAYLQDSNERAQCVLENLGCELQENVFSFENTTLIATGDANIAFREALSSNYWKMGMNIWLYLTHCIGTAKHKKVTIWFWMFWNVMFSSAFLHLPSFSDFQNLILQIYIFTDLRLIYRFHFSNFNTWKYLQKIAFSRFWCWKALKLFSHD